MKQTVADLMARGYGLVLGQKNLMPTPVEKMQEPNKERVFTVGIVLEADEVEILDNKVVIEKRIIARSCREALDKCGFTVKV